MLQGGSASQGRSRGPGRVRASFGVHGAQKGLGQRCFPRCVKAFVIIYLGKTLCAWRGCDATRPGGQGCDQHRSRARAGVASCSPLLRGARGALVSVCGPRHDPAAKGVSLAGGSDPPWAERSRGETPFSFHGLRS